MKYVIFVLAMLYTTKESIMNTSHIKTNRWKIRVCRNLPTLVEKMENFKKISMEKIQIRQ